MTRLDITAASISPNRLALFFGALLTLVTGVVLFSELTGISLLSLLIPYMFTPMVAALAVCYWDEIPLSTVGLQRGRVRWLLAAVVVVFPIITSVTVVSITVPGITVDPTASEVPEIDLTAGVSSHLPVLGLTLLVALTVGTLPALGEEVGWRGYLLWELAPLGFWKASITIGAVWGVWHAPALVVGWNYPSFPYLGIVLMTVVCAAWGPLYTYLVVRAESVLAAALFHSVFNAFALTIAFTEANSPVLSELVASEVGIAGMLVFGLIAIGIALTGPPELSRDFAGGTHPNVTSESGRHLTYTTRNREADPDSSE